MNRLVFPVVAIVLIAIGAYTAFSPESGSLDADTSTHFAVTDTAAVVKIRIADNNGQVAVVKRVPDHPLGLWTLNDRYPARKDATDLLLKTFKRISVRQPVRASAKAGVLKMMASAGKRVDIFTEDSSTPVKTWFIGTPTQSHTGTHMLLELPGSGRAETPYVTHIEGFTGFLSTRFFTDETEWRYTGVYESTADEIATITAVPLDDVGSSATLKWDEQGDQVIAELNGQRLALPQPMLRDQWLRFKKVHVETWNSHLSPEAQDSLRDSALAWQLKVNYKDGREVNLDLHWKAPIMEEYDTDGRLLPHDGSRMYAVHKGECALVQTFVFNPILDFWRSLPQMGIQSSNS
ncbi:MAG: hypothetical protein L7S67_09975 [Flavobacteriales bacterium]|nr:hypothetical protein [Flavobacteriales bacterium]